MAIIKTVNCTGFLISAHCQKAMDLRDITLEDMVETVNFGEVIAEYDADKPFPSKLILKFVKDRPLHIVLAWDPVSFICIFITAYWPDPGKWEFDFKKKKNV